MRLDDSVKSIKGIKSIKSTKSTKRTKRNHRSITAASRTVLTAGLTACLLVVQTAPGYAATVIWVGAGTENGVQESTASEGTGAASASLQEGPGFAGAAQGELGEAGTASSGSTQVEPSAASSGSTQAELSAASLGSTQAERAALVALEAPASSFGALEKGVSVSKYQGNINWQSVAADGISFAMIRVGYVDSYDPLFAANMQGAAAAGIKTGMYLYSQAATVEEAVHDAQFMIQSANGYKVTYPLAIDIESSVVATLTRQELTDIAKAYCDTITEAGYTPVVYSYYSWLRDKMDTSQIPYDIWLARYGLDNAFPNRTIWQSTDQAQVAGINGNVCLEYSFQAYGN